MNFYASLLKTKNTSPISNNIRHVTVCKLSSKLFPFLIGNDTTFCIFRTRIRVFHIWRHAYSVMPSPRSTLFNLMQCCHKYFDPFPYKSYITGHLKEQNKQNVLILPLKTFWNFQYSKDKITRLSFKAKPESDYFISFF